MHSVVYNKDETVTVHFFSTTGLSELIFTEEQWMCLKATVEASPDTRFGNLDDEG